MKKLTTLLFVFFAISSYSQKEDKKDSYMNGFFVEYGQKFFHDDFTGNLKSINNIEDNKLPIEMISINFIGQHTASRKFKYLGYSRFSYIIPKQIEVDSVSQKIRGFNFTLPFYGHKIIDKKYFGLFISEGIQMGRLKLVNESKQKMKNMSISPYVGMVAKINVSKFSIVFLGQYDYDISSKMWKKQWFHKGQDIHIKGIRQSGLTFSTGIGYAIL